MYLHTSGVHSEPSLSPRVSHVSAHIKPRFHFFEHPQTSLSLHPQMSPSSESASLPAPCSSCSSTTVSGLHKKISVLERYKLPSHWQPPSSTGPLGVMKVLLFQMLCICAYGQPRLDTMWASIKLAEEGDLDVWAECSKRTSDQQNNILVVVGVLLASKCPLTLQLTLDSTIGWLAACYLLRLHYHNTACPNPS